MGKNFFWPFFLAALVMGLTGVLLKTLGPLTLVLVFFASAVGSLMAGLPLLMRDYLDRAFWICAALTLSLAAAAMGVRWDLSVAWPMAFLSVAIGSGCLTRLLQKAERPASWLLSSSLGTAIGAGLSNFMESAPSPHFPLDGLPVADFVWRPEVDQSASFFPTVFLGLALIVAFLHLSLVNRRAGPLLAGGFLTGLGYSGLLVMALGILPIEWVVPAFSLAAFFGITKSIGRPRELRAPLLTSLLIRAVLASIVGFYLIYNLDVTLDSSLYLPGALIAALPVYWASQAWASQILLMKPGGERAVAQLLGVYFLGLALGGVVVTVAGWILGPMPAVAVAAGFYLVAALVFSEERFWPFAKTLLSQPG